MLIDGPPKFLRNDPSKSIYFGFSAKGSSLVELKTFGTFGTFCSEYVLYIDTLQIILEIEGFAVLSA